MPIDPSMSKSEIISKEMHAGKPQKQAIAIAYSVKGEGKDTLSEKIDNAVLGPDPMKRKDTLDAFLKRMRTRDVGGESVVNLPNFKSKIGYTIKSGEDNGAMVNTGFRPEGTAVTAVHDAQDHPLQQVQEALMKRIAGKPPTIDSVYKRFRIRGRDVDPQSVSYITPTVLTGVNEENQPPTRVTRKIGSPVIPYVFGPQGTWQAGSGADRIARIRDEMAKASETVRKVGDPLGKYELKTDLPSGERKPMSGKSGGMEETLTTWKAGSGADRIARIRDNWSTGQSPAEATKARMAELEKAKPTIDRIRAVTDAWSPEAREKAAETRKMHSHGSHVAVNAPGVPGHGAQGHVHNDPVRAGGKHFVRTAAGTVHGPLNGSQLAATGKPALTARAHQRNTEMVPTGTGRPIARTAVNPLTQKLLGWRK